MTTWGPVLNAGDNGLRLGYDFYQTPSTVNSGTSSVSVRLKVTVWTERSVFDSTNTFTVGGGWWASSKSVSISHGSSSAWSTSNRTVVFDDTISVAPQFSGSVNRSFSASLSGINAIPGTASVSGTHTVQKKPPVVPNAPSGVDTTYVTDSKLSLTWTRNSTVGGPYEQQIIRRWDSAGGVYKTVATVGGSSTSWTDNSTVANRRYRYQVAAKNSAGTSSDATGPYVSTTPLPPTSVQASKTSSGDILVSWNASHIHAVTGYHVDESTNGGSSWAFKSSVSHPTTSYTHASPSTSTPHQYRVRAVAALDATTLNSDWVESNNVLLLAPPNPPTLLGPTTARDPADPITLSWLHNSVDTTAQVAYGVRYRVNGGSWVTPANVSSSTSEHVVAAGTFTPGDVVEWQARTRGEHATYSVYSSTGTFETSAKPSATITSPGAAVLGDRVTVSWDYFDPEDTGQSGWRAYLREGAGSTGPVLWQSSGSTQQTVQPNAVLADGATYTAQVQVRDGDMLWSDLSEQVFEVSYAQPPAATLDVVWDVDQGAVVVGILVPAPGVDEVDAEYVEVYRSSDGGVTWTEVATNVSLVTSISDPIPPLLTDVLYKVVTVSALPSTNEVVSDPVYTDPKGRAYLNGGPNFGEVVWLKDNLEIDSNEGQPFSVHPIANQAGAMTVAEGPALRSLNLSVRLEPNTLGQPTLAQVQSFVRRNWAPACYRDPKGRRWFVAVHPVGGNEERVWAHAKLSLTEIHYDEFGGE